MPIERELKYVLRHSPSLEADLREAATSDSKLSPTSGKVCAYAIDQGYMQKGSRVRRISPVYLFGIPSAVSKVYHKFTYKHKLTGKPGDLELEFDLSIDDFNLAWPEAERKLYKVRVNLPYGEFNFEVDKFYATSDDYLNGVPPYLVLAEVEFPHGYDYTPADIRVHPIIEKHLLLAVPEGDNRFNNRKLGDRDYVAKALSEVTSAATA